MRLRAALLAALIGAGASAAEFRESADARGRVIERRDGDCVQALEFSASEHLLGYRRGAGCPATLDDELAGFAELLDRILATLPAGERPRSLFWRRIQQPEFQRRLREAATGAGLAGADDATLQRRLPALLQARAAFAELAAIMATRGYALGAVSLEKLERSPGPRGRPPYAALAWFRLAPLPP